PAGVGRGPRGVEEIVALGPGAPLGWGSRGRRLVLGAVPDGGVGPWRPAERARRLPIFRPNGATHQKSHGKDCQVGDEPLSSVSRVPVITAFGPVVGGPGIGEADGSDPLEVLDAVLDGDDQP